MEKTIKSLFLLMIITGTIFTLTACNSGIGSQYPDKDGVEAVADGDAESDDGDGDLDVAESEEAEADADDLLEGVGEAEDNDDASSTDAVGVTGDVSNSAADSAVLNDTPQQQGQDVQYEDGTYTKEATYQTPETVESILVSVTVKDNVVTNVVVTGKAVNETSQKFQGLFIAGVNAVVVGKKLDEIGELSAVNGSSLTPNGFNSAIALLKAEAKK